MGLTSCQIVIVISLSKFRLKGFCTLHKLGGNSKGGGLLLYFREGIPSKFVNSDPICSIEIISVKINSTKRK